MKPTDLTLRYIGGALAGVPQRDLTVAQVDRLVYLRTIPVPGSRGLRRGDRGFPQARGKLVRELTTSGVFANASKEG